MEFETFLQLFSLIVLILFGMDFLITLSTNSTDNWQRKSNFLCLTNILECFQNRFAPSSSKIWLYYLTIQNKTKKWSVHRNMTTCHSFYLRKIFNTCYYVTENFFHELQFCSLFVSFVQLWLRSSGYEQLFYTMLMNSKIDSFHIHFVFC